MLRASFLAGVGQRLDMRPGLAVANLVRVVRARVGPLGFVVDAIRAVVDRSFCFHDCSPLLFERQSAALLFMGQPSEKSIKIVFVWIADTGWTLNRARPARRCTICRTGDGMTAPESGDGTRLLQSW